ncbi:MAG TPA: DegT/DnrJ/EryC1/StrS family aminotransferase [Chitinophagaceae bacterium]|nr:DegT/DnrJ/EryC1/StrS family aminotransferase [Chitinophagaceae bacterium]
MIPVTKTYLPPFEDYVQQLKRAWERGWITNNGILVTELEAKLKEYLGVEHLLFCSNGTVVLQMALRVLNITKEVITTPFSYVATSNAILWEQCEPVFVDIDKNDFCIDPTKIEAAITENTQAILATHVYGSPCNIDAIHKIATRHNLKVIYDGAHCFGTLYNNKQLLSYGDISTCSFHATKLFHTVEGGCIITNDAAIAEQLYLARSFGHIGDNYFSIGINGKNSEFHAAMGLANFPRLPAIMQSRKKICELYDQLLAPLDLQYQKALPGTQYNYAYYPVLFKDETTLLQVIAALKAGGVEPRRYFYPSLNKLPFIKKHIPCNVSEEISGRVLCLPLYDSLSPEEVQMICKIIVTALV